MRPSTTFDKTSIRCRSRSLIAINPIRNLPGILQFRPGESDIPTLQKQDTLTLRCEFMLNRDFCGSSSLAGMSDLREQFLSEDFGRGSIAKAFAGCCVKPVADLDQIGICDR